MKSVLLHVAACVAASVAASAQTYFVDPVNGSIAGDGSVNNPFRSITQAVAQPGITASLTLKLQPGVYSAASGESFPLTLPGNIRIEGVLPQGARIVHQVANPTLATATAALQVEFGSAAGIAVLQDVTFAGNQRGIRVRATQGTGHRFEATNVRTQLLGPTGTAAGIGMHIRANTGLIQFALRQIQSSDRSIGLWLETSGTGSLFGELQACRYTAEPAAALPSGTGVRMESAGLGEIELLADNTAIHRRVRAVEVRQFDETNQYLWLQHCAFHNCGLNTILQPGGPTVIGGVVEHVAGGLNTCQVLASALFGNAGELVSYTIPGYQVFDNLLQDPALAGIQGNFSGDPRWVAAAQGDFHLLPGSPCRNRLPFGAFSLQDADGDDRQSGCAAFGDVGPDESFDSDLYLAGGNLASIGGTVVTNLLGDGGSVALVATGLPSGLPCGQLQISLGSYLLLGQVGMPGSPGNREFGSVSFTIPNSPALVGSTQPVTAAFLTNPTGIPGLDAANHLRLLRLTF